MEPAHVNSLRTIGNLTDVYKRIQAAAKRSQKSFDEAEKKLRVKVEHKQIGSNER